MPSPGCGSGAEDIEPNLDYELDRFAERNGRRVTFNAEARRKFLDFATSGEAVWSANFRDLNGAVTRMATLAPGGRITMDSVGEEIRRLRHSWHGKEQDEVDRELSMVLGSDAVRELDMFDRVQLGEVLRVCRVSRSLSDAGRALFHVSRQGKKTSNDADRLRKYLARFGIGWGDIKAVGT